MNRVMGGNLPARLWHDVMMIAHEGRAPTALPGTMPTAPLALSNPGAAAKAGAKTIEPIDPRARRPRAQCAASDAELDPGREATIATPRDRPGLVDGSRDAIKRPPLGRLRPVLG